MSKKYFLLGLFFLISCTQNIYTFKSVVNFEDTSPTKRTVYIHTDNKDIYNLRGKKIIENIFTNNNWKIVNDLKKANYKASFLLKQDSWQTLSTVANYGKTGISSINTNTYGTINSYGNTSNYFGNSHSTVNYDYGITGYSNVVVNNYRTSLIVDIFDLEKKEMVYQSVLYTKVNENPEVIYLYANDVYTKFFNEHQDTELDLKCYNQKNYGSCNIRDFWDKFLYN